MVSIFAVLRKLQEFPPEGWTFYQPQTGFRPNPWMDFNNVVQQIIANRAGNPRFNLSTDREVVAQELVAYTEKRLRDTYGAGADQWIVPASDGSPPPPFTIPRRQSREGGAAVVGRLSKKFAGIGVVLDWLGDGLSPVAQEEANRRAVICETCSQNKPDASALDLVATGLHDLMEARAEMKLETPFDRSLKTCQVCQCVLTLKVWTPIDHILSKTKPEIMAAFPTWCWVVKKSG